MKHRTSLVDLAPGEEVTVGEILFDGLRIRCAGLGLHEGDRVTLLETSPSNVVLRATRGVALSCPPELARFVEVIRDPES